MERVRKIFVVVVLALVASACAATRHAPEPQRYTEPPRSQTDICAIFAERPEWRAATEATARRWGAPVAIQMAIMQRESSFRHDARPLVRRRTWWGGERVERASSAYGYSQALDGTWAHYLQATGRSAGAARRDHFEDASDFVGWYMATTNRITGVPMGDAYRQYLAYHDGPGGYQRGTYRRQGGRLMRVAQGVAEMAARYARQLDGCRGMV